MQCSKLYLSCAERHRGGGRSIVRWISGDDRAQKWSEMVKMVIFDHFTVPTILHRNGWKWYHFLKMGIFDHFDNFTISV